MSKSNEEREKYRKERAKSGRVIQKINNDWLKRRLVSK
jgi:hypothetical protein